MKRKLKENLQLYRLGRRVQNDSYHILGDKLNYVELSKTPLRSQIINFLLELMGKDAKYLEIGVRFPEQNFDKISSSNKYGVDPGLENKSNPVDFKLTSDEFFKRLREGKILDRSIKFDVIFIDGLHLADQVDRDIRNALDFLNDNGFILVHDCNPPSVFHTNEIQEYKLSPAKGFWNGTTWKAFFKYRQQNDLYSCCIDTDWGIGIISKKNKIGEPTGVKNPFFEYKILEKNRKESLNLISFEEFKKRLLNAKAKSF
ncbi:class I SAM-dependent methyltransferase [Christiangramia echinicola]|uniref:class I SAM-dependent methyltransferase n=1 Tax=Christiangramia echinicola TaxID=279359 RepID=UPI000478818E|nr:class I SAM-dependent methyltransferase [Christiangramia echinicola]